MIAYIGTVTIAGAFRSWVAYICGDPTSHDQGFGSLNPIVHIDPIGFIFLLWFYFKWGLFFTWGRLIVIDPSNFRGYLRIPKMICSYFSDTFAYFVLSLTSLPLLVWLLDVKIIPLSGYMTLFGVISQKILIQNYPDTSTLIIALAFILISIMYLALFLGVLSFIINAFSIIIYIIAEQTGNYRLLSNPYLLILMPLAFLIFFAGPLQYVTIQVLLYVSTAIAQLFHLI